MSETKLIRGARVIDPASGFDDITDILIDGDTIAEIGYGLDAGTIIDADGLIAAPGLIDMRVKAGEPGHENRETLDSAGRAAAAGGVTTMVIMPDTNPVIDDVALLDHIRRRGKENFFTRILIAGALTTGLDGKSMSEIGLMSKAGAVMFAGGDRSVADAQIMRRIMSYASNFEALIAHRPVEPSLAHPGDAHESDVSSRLGLPAAPALNERMMAERDCALAELTGARLLIDMVSSAGTLDVIRRAKGRDIEVAASVSINHLALNELDIGDYRTFAKLEPPLREEHDRQALLRAVEDGLIDVIVSGHDPRPAGEKRRPYGEAGPGAVGLELLLAAGLTLVNDDQLDLMAFLRALTCNPADILGLPQGRIAEGAPADIVLFDMGAPWLCKNTELLSKSKNTPFDGRRLQGKAVLTICEGVTVFDGRDA